MKFIKDLAELKHPRINSQALLKLNRLLEDIRILTTNKGMIPGYFDQLDQVEIITESPVFPAALKQEPDPLIRMGHNHDYIGQAPYGECPRCDEIEMNKGRLDTTTSRSKAQDLMSRMRFVQQGAAEYKDLKTDKERSLFIEARGGKLPPIHFNYGEQERILAAMNAEALSDGSGDCEESKLDVKKWLGNTKE